jgi:formylglycine-generating enzyme required for sulfatase activity
MATVDRALLRKACDWDAHLRGWRRRDHLPSGRHLRDLAVFSDAPFAPERAIIPTGEFLMGSTEEEHNRFAADNKLAETETPRHPVAIAQRFALARTPLTFAEFDQFCRDTERKRPDDVGWGRDARPVINIGWEDAAAWCAWMSEQTGAAYRLPREADWEYAARAGTSTAYPWGEDWNPTMANGVDGGPGRTSETGSYPPNGFGLRDMIGNVWEWCADGWQADYRLPRTQHPYAMSGVARRVVRGGSWADAPGNLRPAVRYWVQPDIRSANLGFRPARTMSVVRVFRRERALS